ncbi:helix-turn-helix domain-containing protein [Streptomyces sp. CWNU-52B]|uniref:PucR family transcriptional regulator n=1 Tax=unclassified Streptomyces TaxID=2593676 RepID=UPI0039BF7002
MHAAIVKLSRSALEGVDAAAGQVAEEVIATEEDLGDESLVPRADIRETTSRLLRNFFLHIAEGVPPDLAAVREVGRRRAQQGVPLTAVLHGFRIGFRGVWNLLVEQVAPDDTETMRALFQEADRMWLLLDDYSAQLRDGYRDRAAGLLRIAEEEREQHLDVLFASGPVEVGRKFLGAEMLGLPRAGRFLVIAGDGITRATREAWDSVLALRGARVLWRHSPRRVIGLISVSPSASEWPGLPRHLDVGEARRLGVSSAFSAVEDAAHALHQALMAFESIPRTEKGVRRYGDDPLGCLIAASADDSIDLCRIVLGELMALQPALQESLLETLTAWFHSGGSVDTAAHTLFCHRNTVRYRLRHIEELTGLHLKDPRDSAQLYLAVQTLTHQGGNVFPAP